MSYCDFFRNLGEYKVEEMASRLKAIKPGHQERVGEIIRSFCELNDCPTIFGDLQLLNYYKDIGLSVFSQLICQPKELSREEKKLVNFHSIFSAHILEQEGFEEVMGVDLFESVLYHHERWDGKGFFRLRGKQIPLYARLLAPIDFYVALISTRPYRGAFSQEEAIQQIFDQAEKMFDPIAVGFAVEAIKNPVRFMGCACPQYSN